MEKRDIINDLLINDLKKRLLAKYSFKKLVLFGSAASDRPEKAKDIDLCVIKDDVENKSEEFIKIRKILGRTVVPLDVLIFNETEFNRRKDIWGTVQYEIDKKGKILYEAK